MFEMEKHFEVCDVLCAQWSRDFAAMFYGDLQQKSFYDDLVAFMTAGAYGAVMASEYNTRPLAPEVLVNGAEFAVVRPRPAYEEMLAREPLAPWLR